MEAVQLIQVEFAVDGLSRGQGRLPILQGSEVLENGGDVASDEAVQGAHIWVTRVSKGEGRS